MPEEWIEVGVVVDKRSASSPWLDYHIVPAAVLVGVPAAEPLTVLERGPDFERFYIGACALVLASTETANYRANLASGQPRLWVVLHPETVERPLGLLAVTADPTEGEAHTETSTLIVETVEMPDEIIAMVDDFIARHHVERVFEKRQRKRYDPEALARGRPPRKDQ